MAFIGVQISEAVKAQFAARAQSEGGQSALLRRLIGTVIDPTPHPVRPLATGVSDKITVRFRRSERTAIADAAAARGMTRTSWITALVRARLGLGLPLSGGEEEALRAIARELHRVGGNLNQIARSAQLAAEAGAPVTFDPSVLEEARDVAAEAMGELRRVLARSAASWQVPV